MNVGTIQSSLNTTLGAPTSAPAGARPKSFSSVLSEVTAKSHAPESADFTNMTRQEMFDWTNAQIRAGKMSVEASSPFLAMTMAFSEVTGQSVDMATDPARIDFVEKALLGIDHALATDEPETAMKFKAAMEVMLSHRQSGVDVRA